MSELQKVIPIRRAMMRLKLQVALAAETELEQMLRKEHAVIETQSSNQSQARNPLPHPFADLKSVGGIKIQVLYIIFTRYLLFEEVASAQTGCTEIVSHDPPPPLPPSNPV